MSRTFAKAIEGLNNAILIPFPHRVKRKTRARYIENLRAAMTEEVKTKNGHLKILTHKGAFVTMAAEQFYTEEPETIEWIDNYVEEGDILWDIGANIGSFSMYAAKSAKAYVYAFEPFGLNYKILVEHAFINNLDTQIHPYSIALGEETKLENLHLREFKAAGAINSVGHAKNQFGEFDSVMSQATLLIKPEDFCSIFGAPKPDHIKLDVDTVLKYKLYEA